jgi:hypothetical protein
MALLGVLALLIAGVFVVLPSVLTAGDLQRCTTETKRIEVALPEPSPGLASSGPGVDRVSQREDPAVPSVTTETLTRCEAPTISSGVPAVMLLIAVVLVFPWFARRYPGTSINLPIVGVTTAAPKPERSDKVTALVAIVDRESLDNTDDLEEDARRRKPDSEPN